MIRSILTREDPFLRKIVKKVDKIDSRVKKIVRDMVDTVRSRKALGLAANQIGEDAAIFVMCTSKAVSAKVDVFINPEIVQYHNPTVDDMAEGCLSLPGVNTKVLRSYMIDVQYTDISGAIKKDTFTSLSAIVFQHELDHLKGILMTDYAGDAQNG